MYVLGPVDVEELHNVVLRSTFPIFLCGERILLATDKSLEAIERDIRLWGSVDRVAFTVAWLR